jgi:hypothetical protein
MLLRTRNYVALDFHWNVRRQPCCCDCATARSSFGIEARRKTVIGVDTLTPGLNFIYDLLFCCRERVFRPPRYQGFSYSVKTAVALIPPTANHHLLLVHLIIELASYILFLSNIHYMNARYCHDSVITQVKTCLECRNNLHIQRRWVGGTATRRRPGSSTGTITV